MANKRDEAVNYGESEGDSLSSLKVIARKSTKAKREVSQRTFSTSEVDREEKRAAKIVTEFLSLVTSPVNSTRHAPLSSQGTEANNDKDIPVQQTAELNLDAVHVCKKKMPRKVTSPNEFYSPPVRHRPKELPSMSRPRSRSLPACSDERRAMVSN